VKICSLYGAGFYFIPGTDTCLKIGGYLRAEMNFNANGTFNPFRAVNFDDPSRNREVTRVRGAITVDARSQTEYGTLRAYIFMGATNTNGGNNNALTPGISAVAGGSAYDPIFAYAYFLQFAGFTAGKTASFFDFDLQPYSNQTNFWGSNQAGTGIPVFAYTAQFGNGLSGSLSIEDTTQRRSNILDAAVAPIPAIGYGGRRWPDLVANIRIDQAWGSAQVMGAIHDVYSLNTSGAAGGSTDDKVGWAVGAGIKFNVPQIGKGDYLIAQVSYDEGATNYNLSNSGAGGVGAFSYANGFPAVTKLALGPVFDAVQTAPGNLSLSKSWSITGGYEHRWNPSWRTSLYGAYGQTWYSDAASAVIATLAPGAAGSAAWSLWQVGSRTVWTPVENLDLSVEALYTDLNRGAFEGSAGGLYGNKGFLAGIFRVQRNFWP
jgi:hypothetical protein